MVPFLCYLLLTSHISRWDPGEVKSEPWPCVPPGSAVPRVSPATGVGQGERTMQELKKTFIFIGKRRGSTAHRGRSLQIAVGGRRGSRWAVLPATAAPKGSVRIQFFRVHGSELAHSPAVRQPHHTPFLYLGVNKAETHGGTPGL